MTTNMTTIDEGNGFVLRRSVSTGFVSEIDPVVKDYLDDLNELLGKAIFKPDHVPLPAEVEDAEDGAVAKVAIRLKDHAVRQQILDTYSRARAANLALEPEFDNAGLHKKVLDELKRTIADARAAATKRRSMVAPDIVALLRKPLTAKKTDKTWNATSLAYEWDRLATAAAAANPKDYITLSDYIDSHTELSKLKYQFTQRLQTTWATLDDDVKRALDGRSAFEDYLVAYAYHVKNVRDIHALMNFALTSKEGFDAMVDYAVVSAARALVDRETIKVDKIDDDDSDIVTALRNRNNAKNGDRVPLSRLSFESAARAVIHQFIGDSKYELVLNKYLTKNAKDINISKKKLEAIRPVVLQYIKESPVTIGDANADTLIPPLIAQARGATAFEEEPTAVDVHESEKDFDVDLFDDDEPQLEISESAVKCAAQLYYGMVLGDELDIFDVVNFFTHKYLVRGQIEIQDRRLRDDLQMYVFSGKFTDLKTGKIVDRTRPAERQMFYSQVFNQGSAPGTDDMIVKNDDYQRLWKVLMLESARYLERAQLSPNPNSFVSKQNVMQAVEDLQYNLSTHCVGMATVISPLIHAELDFVIRRILMRDEVRRQVAPAGGSWWRVVEALYMAMKNTRPKATILYNKAKLGNSIIRKIAEYNAASFENNANFSAFISDVDAFITTQSILQEALTDDLKRTDEDQPPITGPTNGSGVMPALPGGSSSGAEARDDWDF